MEIVLRENERIDDLQFKGLKIIQNTKKFCFGMDAVLLSHFADVRKGDRVVDLGTGTGIIPILLAGRNEVDRVYGIEIQSEMAEMAQRSVKLNHLEDKIKIIEADLKEAPAYLGKGKFDLVICNPPYKKLGSGLLNPHDSKAIARHELLCSLQDVLEAAGKLLVNGGRFAMVHQTDRLVEILYGMREVKLEPKRIRLIHPSAEKPPNLMLIEGVRNGKPHLKWMPSLFVYDRDGNYTEEIKRIYAGEEA